MGAEYIVAKAVRDGVVDATINHQDKFVTSNEVTDIYSSTEPHDAFHQRISFCLSLHNDLVKSMRYPPNAYRRYLEDPEQRKNREDDTAEIVASMEEEEEDFGAAEPVANRCFVLQQKGGGGARSLVDP